MGKASTPMVGGVAVTSRPRALGGEEDATGAHDLCRLERSVPSLVGPRRLLSVFG